MSLLAAVTLHPSTFPPLAVGFMGLGTGQGLGKVGARRPDLS